MFAQLIDDRERHARVAAVSWIEPELRKLDPMEQAKRVGELLAERAKAAGVDRPASSTAAATATTAASRALAEGAREGGLEF